MNSLEAILGNPLVALFLIVGLGLLIGAVSINGIGLGSSGVLFVALLAGHFGLQIPAGVGNFGLALFVYCVGIGAGPRFFPALAREGGGLAKLAFLIVGVGAAAAWILGDLFDLPGDLTVGLFAGAMTSTPALAAASESAASAEGVAIGYGIAYPFGVIGVVLFVQLLPRMLKGDGGDDPAEESRQDESESVKNMLVEVTNQNLVGRRIEDATEIGLPCQISRVLRGERLAPLGHDDRFEAGQILLVVSRQKDLAFAASYIGKPVERAIAMDTEHERQRLVATSKSVGGKKLSEIGTLRNYGVVVTRVSRLGQTFVPTPDTRVETYDVLTAVGDPAGLEKFAKAIGHRPQAFEQTDLISLALGLTAGILLGMLPFGLPGGEPMTLGLAGGPLFVALVLGYFGKVGRLVGHIPRPTRLLLQELGLVLFLANAGIVGGASLGATVGQYGASVFLVGAAITLLPPVVAYPFGRKLLRLTRAQTLGGVCGGMTSTPALGALTSSSSSQKPIVSYATAYPVALIMMTVFAKILMQAMGL